MNQADLKGVRAKGGGVELRLQHKGKRYSKYLAIPLIDENISLLRDVMRKYELEVKRGWRNPDIISTGCEDLELTVKICFRNAKKRGNYFLSKDEEVKITERASFKCEITGIPFSTAKGDFHRSPYSPSLDRINSKVGYNFHNCRLVCVAANFAMNEWGESVFERVAESYVAKKFIAKHIKK